MLLVLLFLYIKELLEVLRKYIIKPNIIELLGIIHN